jgi:hypothetical protein
MSLSQSLPPNIDAPLQTRQTHGKQIKENSCASLRL